MRERRILVRRMTLSPARTILSSFMLVIVLGTWLLMLPASTTDGAGLALVDALFTATSAVCVTGLIVVDTATAFTGFGRLVILLLIQIGGLGIMILSFFSIFVRRSRLRMEDKLLISFALSSEDMSGLTGAIKRIFLITFCAEAVGAVFLFFFFGATLGYTWDTLFLAVFHGVSAFCNAGFALFSNSLEGFRSHVGINLTIMLLIICGGLGFAVTINLGRNLQGRIRNLFSRVSTSVPKIALNTRIVLWGTVLLILTAFFLFYGLEHGNSLRGEPLFTQYLSALFQAVTLRTAGFNTIGFADFRSVTLFFMLLYMVIGAGSGGTAGGVKINTVAAIAAYVRAYLKGEKQVVLAGYSLSADRIHRSFLILLSAAVAVGLGTFCLLLTESLPLEHLLFEVCSAVGTVGLSTGITSSLTQAGRLLIVLLMYFGRLGPLTILAAARTKSEVANIRYPAGDISIG